MKWKKWFAKKNYLKNWNLQMLQFIFSIYIHMCIKPCMTQESGILEWNTEWNTEYLLCEQ